MKEKKTILLAMAYCPQVESIEATLKYCGYNVVVANIARAVMSLFDRGHPHLLLADMDLPGQDGLSMIRSLRKTYEAPIIMLAEAYSESVAVAALDAGANDVLVLPFGRPEHLARIRAALRWGSGGKLGTSRGIYSEGGLTIDYDRRTVAVDGRAVHLTPIEFRILTLLTRNAGKVMGHEQIINDIWGPYNSDNLVLRVNMANIRRKIEANPAEPRYILTEVGVGYRAAGG